MMKDGLLVRQRYLDALDSCSGDNGTVKVVTGMRGVGKTTLVNQFVSGYVSKKKLRLINLDFDSNSRFDFKRVEDVRTKILKDCDGAGKTVVVLHEIHKLPGWEQMVSDLVKANVGEFFITASDDSVMLMKTVEGMSDKVLELRVTPLSLPEFMELNNLRSPASAVESYLKIGGLPVVRADMSLDLAYTILDGVFCSAILNDVLPYGNNLPPLATVSMARHIMVESGSVMDSQDVSDASGSSFRTSSKILCSMIGCYMVFENEGRSLFSKLMRSKIVYYSADLGLRNCVKGHKAERLSLGENAVMIELKRLGYSVTINGDDGDRTFEAKDDEGVTEYSVTLDFADGKCTDKKVYITMDEGNEKDYTLSGFLSDVAE